MTSSPHQWTTERHFLYVADPLCSWCYGFSPVVRQLTTQFADRLPVRVVMGGLRAGNTKPMRDEDRTYIKNAWQKVGAATGRPFDLKFFKRESFTYDTEPVCRAVVLAREWHNKTNSDPAVSPLDLMERLSTAFYANNRDVTNVETLADIAAEAGFDRAQFLALLLDPDIRNLTFRDFLTSQQMGVEGFPMLAAGTEGGGYALITHGYRPIDGLAQALETWLSKGAPVTPAT